MPTAKGRLVDSLPFVTSPVGRLLGVATDLGLLRPSSDTGDLEIAAVFAEPGAIGETVGKLRDSCGWPVGVRGNLRRIEPPSAAELSLLRSFDPERKLLG
jgi:hypothetical protein